MRFFVFQIQNPPGWRNTRNKKFLLLKYKIRLDGEIQEMRIFTF